MAGLCHPRFDSVWSTWVCKECFQILTRGMRRLQFDLVLIILWIISRVSGFNHIVDRKEGFYLTTHPTHLVTVIWRQTKARCRHMGTLSD